MEFKIGERPELTKFVTEAQKSAKEFLDDAQENLEWCDEQVAYWQERVRVSSIHLQECKKHYELTLTWSQLPTQEA